jgi:hypothetical protein
MAAGPGEAVRSAALGAFCINLCHTLSYCIISSVYVILYHRGYQIVSFHFISFRFISFHIISYIINMSYIYVINNEILQIMIYLCHVTFDMFV